jgi:hypothetical protein
MLNISSFGFYPPLVYYDASLHKIFELSIWFQQAQGRRNRSQDAQDIAVLVSVVSTLFRSEVSKV